MMANKGHTWYGKVFSLALLLAWMVVISGFSSQNGEASSGVSRTVSEWVVNTCGKLVKPDMTETEEANMAENMETAVRKLAHMTEYAVLSVLVFFCMYCFEIRRHRKRYSVLFCLLYASADEIHQLFVQGRSGRFMDVCIDTAGAILAMIVVFLIKTCYDKKHLKIQKEAETA